MSRIVSINGQFLDHQQAMVAMDDRGYQFADGVYEVISMYDGRLLDGAAHLDRLERSLRELSIPEPMARGALECRINELIRRNRKRNGLIYLQVTRGVSARNHINKPGIQPVISMTIYPAKYPGKSDVENGVSVITVPDQRWIRCDIKSIALLPNILARNQAAEARAREAWQFDANGMVTEGSTSNAYLVKEGAVITHPADIHILGGITRDTVLELARNHGISVVERPFHLDEIHGADEAFMSSASSFVLPVTSADGKPIGSGKPGPVTLSLLAAYHEHILEQPERL